MTKNKKILFIVILCLIVFLSVSNQKIKADDDLIILDFYNTNMLIYSYDFLSLFLPDEEEIYAFPLYSGENLSLKTILDSDEYKLTLNYDDNEFMIDELGFGEIKIDAFLNEPKTITLKLYKNNSVIGDISLKNLFIIKDANLVKTDNFENDINALFLESSSTSNLSFLENYSNLEYLNINFALNLDNLDFIDNFKNLKSLYLNSLANYIGDFSELNQLNHLEYLSLHFFGYDSATQINLDMPNLTNFSITLFQDLEISSFSFIQTFSNLKTLSINSNKLDDISFIKNLSNLESISISSNQEINIDPISNLTNISYISLHLPNTLDFSSLDKLSTTKINIDTNFYGVATVDNNSSEKGNTFEDLENIDYTLSFYEDELFISLDGPGYDYWFDSIKCYVGSSIYEFEEGEGISIDPTLFTQKPTSILIETYSYGEKKGKLVIDNILVVDNADSFFVDDNQNLNISNLIIKKIQDFSSIASFSNLEYLNITVIDKEVFNFQMIENFSNLRYLIINSYSKLDLTPLENLNELKFLSLNVKDINSLPVLESVKKSSIVINDDCNLNELSNLVNVKELELELKYNNYNELNNLEEMANVETLSLAEVQNLKNLDKFPNLQKLSIRSFSLPLNLNGIQGLTQLKRLELFSDNYENLEYLSELSELQYLSFMGFDGQNLNFLNNLTNLSEIFFSDCPLLVDVSALENLDNLEYGSFFNCINDENQEPLLNLDDDVYISIINY